MIVFSMLTLLLIYSTSKVFFHHDSFVSRACFTMETTSKI